MNSLLEKTIRPRRIGGGILLAGALAGWGGCAQATYRAEPVSAESLGAELAARSLQDEGLRQFLARNLGADPQPWPRTSWDFETLCWVAFYYNPTLDVARAQWQGARRAVATARERPNPTLSLIPGYATNGVAPSPWLPAINLDFLLETKARRDRRVAAQELAAEAARLNILSSAWQVRSDLRHALIDSAIAERRMALMPEQTARQREIAQLLEQQRQAGAVSSVEVAAARTALIRAEAAAGDADGQLRQARGRLAQALGVPLTALQGVRFEAALGAPEPPLSAAALEAARRQSLQSRADLLGALARYEGTQAGLELEMAKRNPDLHLGPGYQYDQGVNKWTLGFSFELPLFHPVNAGAVGEAEARRREAAAEVLAVQAGVIAAIDGAAQAQAAAAGQLARARQLGEQIAGQAASAEARFQAGATDRLEYLNARLEQGAAALALLDAQSGSWLAAGQLEDALQVPLPNFSAVLIGPRDPYSPPIP